MAIPPEKFLMCALVVNTLNAGYAASPFVQWEKERPAAPSESND